MIQQTLELNSKAGLLAIPVTQLVQVASRFNSDIFLTHNGRKVNVKSILGVLSLGIPSQAKITLEASGQDEEEALRQITKTLASFNN
ncbi:HPr family phosphocarrier protein [Metabacillus herbersteinensis]|uniref:HPr family phosphocarrier protein n=1 Tax=Metabacillus herbersteinensis TaxID=283816 RepID=A0ABV6GBH4_9BACI